MRNCLECGLFTRCKNSQRGFSFSCKKFKPFQAEDIFKTDKNDVYIDDNFIEESYKFEKVVLSEIKESIRNPFPKNIKVDEQEIKQAPNFYTFVSSPKYLGLNLYTKQMAINLQLFNDVCPYCSDMDFVKNVEASESMGNLLDHVVLYKRGKCPKCKRTRTDALLDKKIKPYSQLVGLAGQRCGKTLMANIGASYVQHKFLCIPNPITAYNILKNSLLSCTFVALTFSEAMRQLWTPFYNLMADSPWFQEYHSMLDHYGQKYGEELYKFKDTFFHYKHKGLIGSAAAPDKRKLRGKTRYIAAIDELGWFNALSKDAITLNAAEVYKSLNNSMETTVDAYESHIKDGNYNMPAPFFANISSPSSKQDMICTLYERSKKSRHIFGFHHATWEIHPKLTFKKLKKRYKHDLSSFWRDFGAVAPMSSSVFIDSWKIFKESSLNYINGGYFVRSIKDKYTIGKFHFNWTEKTVPKIMALDAGAVNNSFAITIAHIDAATNNIVYDVMAELIPIDGHEINFLSMKKELEEIIKAYNVVLVVADRWESRTLLHSLESKKVEIKRFSVKYGSFVSFKEGLIGPNIFIPQSEIKLGKIEKLDIKDYPDCFDYKSIAHFIFQCLTVRDMKKKSVEKGEKTTDDIFRSAVLAHHFLTDPLYKDKFVGTIKSKTRSVGIIGHMGGNGVPMMTPPSNMGSIVSMNKHMV